MRVYLDNAATTLVKPKSVASAYLRALKTTGSPGRGGHEFAARAAETVFSAREKAARLFNVKDPENIVFTFNATHSLNIAIFSLIKPGMRVVISGYEHNSVVRPLNAIGAKTAVAAGELFEPEAVFYSFEHQLMQHTDAVIINYVSNVFGFIQPVERIAQLCHYKGIPFIIDASQAAGVIDIDAEKLGADFIAMPGHKGLYGPPGTGILIASGKAVPFMHGGSGSDSMAPLMPDYLPDMLEAGTHNTPGIAGLSAGLDFVLSKTPEKIFRHEQELISQMARGLEGIKRVVVYSSAHQFCQSGVLSFNLYNTLSEDVAGMLSERGVAVRAGLHCSPLAHKTALTLPDGTVRASVSAFSTKNDVYYFLNTMEDIAKRYDKSYKILI